MRRLVLLVLVGLLASASAAEAKGLVPLPEVLPPVIWSSCPDGLGGSCTSPGEPIWLAHRGDYWHELGHHYDYTVLTDSHRNRFRQLIGDLRPWRLEPNSPHEQFAEAYRLCALHKRLPWEFEADYDYWPTRRSHRGMCGFIRRTGYSA